MGAFYAVEMPHGAACTTEQRVRVRGDLATEMTYAGTLHRFPSLAAAQEWVDAGGIRFLAARMDGWIGRYIRRDIRRARAAGDSAWTRYSEHGPDQFMGVA